MISRLKSRFKNNDRIFLKCILNKYTKLFSLYIYIFFYTTHHYLQRTTLTNIMENSINFTNISIFSYKNN